MRWSALAGVQLSSSLLAGLVAAGVTAGPAVVSLACNPGVAAVKGGNVVGIGLLVESQPQLIVNNKIPINRFQMFMKAEVRTKYLENRGHYSSIAALK